MIRFEPGTVIAEEHLREFDLEKALAGHPLATAGGAAVRCFRQQGAKDFAYDWWAYANKWLATEAPEHILPFNLRLAPLAIKDGRGLHAGDEIEVSIVVSGGGCEWTKIGATIKGHLSGFYKDYSDQWRWPENKA